MLQRRLFHSLLTRESNVILMKRSISPAVSSLVFVLLLITAVTSCTDVFFASPSKSSETGLVVSFSRVITSASTAVDDQIRIRVSGTGVAIDTTVVAAPAQQTRVQLNVGNASDGAEYQIVVEVRRDSVMQFRGTASAQLRTGQSTPVELALLPPPVSTVVVSPSASSLFVGATAALATTLRESGGVLLGARVTGWSSSNQTVASVSATGVVTGVAPGGPVTITATSEGRSGTAQVTVLQVPVATVTVTPAGLTVAQGSTATLTATPRDRDGVILTGRPVTWSSNSPAIAAVSATGVVTGVAPGSAIITATSEGQRATVDVTVQAPPVATVRVTPATVNISIQQSVALSASVQDANGNTVSGAVVQWTSQNVAVATVNSSGVVTAQSAGTTTIRATSGAVVGTATVTVAAPVARIAIVLLGPALTVGGTLQMGASALDASGNTVQGVSFQWTSGTTSVATIGVSTGIITAVAAGTSVIKATAPNGVEATTTLTVSQAIATITVTPAPGTLDALGKTLQLTAVARDSGGNVVPNPGFVWAVTAGPSAVSVSNAGLVTAIANGSTVITVSAGPRASAQIPITVSQVASSINWITQPAPGVAKAILPATRLAVMDSRGNTVTNGSDAFSVTIQNNPLGGTLSGTQTKNAVGGIIDFNDLRISKKGSNYSLRVVNGSGSLGIASVSFAVDYDRSDAVFFPTTVKLNGIGQDCGPDICMVAGTNLRVPGGGSVTLEFSGRVWNQPTCNGCLTQIVFSYSGVSASVCVQAPPGAFPGNPVGLTPLAIPAPPTGGTYLVRYKVMQEINCQVALNNYQIAPASSESSVGYIIVDQGATYSALQTIRFNGDVPYVVVKPGTPVSYSSAIQVANDQQCPACQQQIVLGIGNTAQGCLFNNIPGPQPGFNGVGSLILNAPAVPGVYEVRYKNELQPNCASAMNAYNVGPPGTGRAIGTIVVVP